MLDWRRKTENWSLNWDNCGRHISEEKGRRGGEKERIREMKGERREKGMGR